MYSLSALRYLSDMVYSLGRGWQLGSDTEVTLGPKSCHVDIYAMPL